MENLQAQVAKMQTQLEDWGAHLDAMMAEAQEAYLAARASYQDRMDDLETKHRAAKTELEELRAVVDGVDADADDVAQDAMDDLRAMHEVARSRLDELLAAGGATWAEGELDPDSVRDAPEAGGGPEANVATLAAQLDDWSNQLDHLVAGYLKAGSDAHDAYRLRIDHLRARHAAVQAKLAEYKLPTGNGAPPWAAFRASIADDWTTLEDGFEDLTH